MTREYDVHPGAQPLDPREIREPRQQMTVGYVGMGPIERQITEERSALSSLEKPHGIGLGIAAGADVKDGEVMPSKLTLSPDFTMVFGYVQRATHSTPNTGVHCLRLGSSSFRMSSSTGWVATILGESLATRLVIPAT